MPSGNAIGHNDNGQLYGVNDLNAAGRNVVFTYDDLGRISSENSGDSAISASFTIDPWGNRNQQAGTVNEYFPASSSTNQISIAGFSFDAAGRMLSGTFAPVAAQRGFSWDPRGQMLTYSEGGTLVETYQYDAFGRRVRAIPATGGASTFYLYGSGDGSHPAAEYTYPNWQNNVLAGGAVIATVGATGTATTPSPTCWGRRGKR